MINELNIRNAFNVVRDIINKGLLMIDTISKPSEACKNYAKTLRKVAKKLINKVDGRSYQLSLMYHSLSNMASIASKVISTVKAFKQKEFEKAGVSGGELMKFIFFWDI